jgi:hypothetical protein
MGVSTTRKLTPMKTYRRSERTRSLTPAGVSPSALIKALAVLAVLAGVVLLLSGFFPPLAAVRDQELAAAPLMIIGVAWTSLQLAGRPPPRELARRLSVGLAFVLWGIDALLPSTTLSETIGRLVILLYVVDLALAVRDQLAAQ